MIEFPEIGPCRTRASEVVALVLLTIAFLVAFWLPSLPLEKQLFSHWDKILHTVAGASLAVLVASHLPRKYWVAFVFVIGFIFEIAEFFTDGIALYGGFQPYLFDTLGDLIVDMLGAWIVVLGHKYRVAPADSSMRPIPVEAPHHDR